MRDPVDRQSVHTEMELARATFRTLLATASSADLRRRTNGTRWTNHQLLVHMLLGYVAVLGLLRLVRFVGRLPDGSGRRLAQLLDAAAPAFHVVNYLASCGGALVLHGRLLAAALDRTIAALRRHLDEETDQSLAVAMAFPARWDPHFRDTMTLLEVYHYGTQHYTFHARQLTLRPETGPAGPSA